MSSGPQTPRDAFDTLGLEPSFALDRSVLDARQRELSRALHPDRYVQSLPAERRRALSEAISVNEAHRALLDPIRRAEVLCARLGLDAGGSPDQMFLMEMMELREKLSAARTAADLDAVASLAAVVEAQQKQSLSGVARAFESALAATATDASSAAGVAINGPLSAELGKLRFYRRFLDEVAAIEDDLS